VNAEALKLTIYHGERDRVPGGAFLADALSAIFARHELRASIVMRGAGGFGLKQRLRTDRLLTLSEDLPVVSVAVDERERIERALADVEALAFDGLVTLERARLVSGPVPLPQDSKLTVYLERAARDHERVVGVLHRHGVAGASVLLGVDGTARGERRRARFFSRNANVPLMVVSVGAGDRLAAALAELSGMLAEPVMTIERVRICKRDGRRLAEPEELAGTDEHGLALWQLLTVYGGERDHAELVRALRAEHAAGATSLRGIWGYHGDHAPHGDVLWQLRRRVPVLTAVVDEPAAIRRLYRVVDRLTERGGLVTTETVPASRATGPGIASGGFRLARPGR
jgi:PII-like signaling protein